MQLRLARIEQGLFQSDIANLLGVDQSTASRIETGRQRPTLEQAIAIAKRFGIAPEAWVTKAAKVATRRAA